MKHIIISSAILFSCICAHAQRPTQFKTVALAATSTHGDTYLQGSYTVDPSALKVTFKWFKAQGPKATIATPDSLGTKVTSLIRGTYLFGFKVTDVTHRLSNTDYIKVTVK